MKIGLIDHHLHNWHSDVFLKILRSNVGEGKYEICYAYESDPLPDKENWCKLNNVEECASPEEVVEKSDAIFVMAPDNIEDHLKLGIPAYKSGKPTYVDKYLSTSIKDAKEIIATCKANNTTMTSASSLRFANAVIACREKLTSRPKEVFARGYGHWHPYAVHTITLALPIFGTDCDRIINTGTLDAPNVTIADGDRRCNIQIFWGPKNHCQAAPWQIGAIQDDQVILETVDPNIDYYPALMKEVVKFLKTGVSPISEREMLLVSIIDELGEKSREMGGVWLPIE